MKPPKAIEILELDKTCDFEGDADDLKNAIQLGIEALKRLELGRCGIQRFAYSLLPGETEGDEDE